jgi:hypothetical protein
VKAQVEASLTAAGEAAGNNQQQLEQHCRQAGGKQLQLYSAAGAAA